MNDCRNNCFLPDAPDAFAQAILDSRALIRNYERRRRQLRRRALLAACTLLCVSAAAVGVGALRRPVRDSVAVELPAAPSEEQAYLPPKFVLSHPEDAYYHALPSCARCADDAVELPVDTAENFGKLACPACLPEHEEQRRK